VSNKWLISSETGGLKSVFTAGSEVRLKYFRKKLNNLKLMNSLKIAILVVVLAFGLRAKADGLYDITFTDGGANVGFGQIDVESGYAVSGYFDVTAGLAAGNYTLYTAGGTGTYQSPLPSPAVAFLYDNAVYLSSNPQYPINNPFVDNNGLLFTDVSNSEVDLWAAADNGTYSFDAYIDGSYISNPTGIVGASTITPAPEPPGLGFITLMLVPAGMFILRWRTSKL
jgi:hypothetical protein